MFDYVIYGLKLRTDVEFPQLIKECTDREPDIYIVQGVMPAKYEAEERYMCNIEQGESYFNNSILKMYIEEGKTLTYQILVEVNESNYKAFLLGYGISILLLQRGMLAIHCSALLIQGKAYLIAGRSGSGKSTVTSHLLRGDVKLLADDIAAVYKDEKGQVVVEPAFPYQKLCRDAALEMGYELDKLIYIDEEKDKFLVPCHEKFYPNKAPIGGMIIIYQSSKTEDVQCHNIVGLNALYTCADNMFLEPILQNRVLEPFVGQRCLEMASGTSICLVRRPKGKDTVKEVLKEVEDFIKRQTN